MRSSPKDQNQHLKTTALDTKVSESLFSFLWTEFKKEMNYNSRTGVLIYIEVLMFELGRICLLSIFVPIPHLSFEGHKVPWKILELGLGFLLLTKDIIPHNASSAAPDLKRCVQSQHNSKLPSICYLLGKSLTRAELKHLDSVFMEIKHRTYSWHLF